MIGKVTKGRGFVGLGQYLESGSNGVSPDRVDWIESRNLPTNDPRTAAILMRATAHESDRVEKPVYHVSVSFDAGDRANRETMSRVADRVIADLGLDEHQVLIVAHRDKDHPHLHMMVNRVHPETGRVWDDGHDYGRIERSLREQERELGMREVPGHHFQLDGQERPARSEGLTTGQLRMWERTGTAPFDELVRSTVTRDFNEAASWTDLERRLARHGLRLESKQAGLIITDGVEVVRASDIGPAFSRQKLEQRFGVMYGDHEEDRSHSEARDPARATEKKQRTTGRTAIARTDGEIDRPAREAGRSGREYRAEAERDGEKERAAPERDRRGRRAEQPDHGGHSATSERAAGAHDRDGAGRVISGRAAEAAGGPRAVDANKRDPAGAHGRTPGRDRSSVGNADLDSITRLLDRLEQRVKQDSTRDQIVGEMERARERLSPLARQRFNTREPAKRFKEAVDRVYADPIRARRTIRSAAERDGPIAAMQQVASRPASFGELRGVEVGPVRSAERKTALQQVPGLSRATAEYLTQSDFARLKRPEYRAAQAAIATASEKLRSLDAELDRAPGISELRRRISEKVAGIRPSHRREFAHRLSPTQRMLLNTAMAAGLAFAREQGHER
jgi:relaxase-like protein/DNA relaxase TraI-like protein